MTIIESVKNSKRILIVCHIRPDGDCLGAGFALKRIAEKEGKSVDFVTDSPFPGQYAFIDDFLSLNDIKYGDYDLGIAVDCADDLRLGKYLQKFKKCKVTINVDHHRTNNRFADFNIVDPDKSSTCELLFNLIENDGVIDSSVATLLYLGISTDTGNFMHNNTTSSTLSTAAKLLSLGADLEKIINGFYKNNTKNKLMLIAKAIESIRFFHDDKIAVMTVTAEMLEKCGCVMADTEGLIDYAMSIGSVHAAVCMSEQNVRSYKVSFRAKDVDVAAAAATFGGGGHKLAAGCVVNGHYEDVVRKVVKAVSDGMTE